MPESTTPLGTLNCVIENQRSAFVLLTNMACNRLAFRNASRHLLDKGKIPDLQPKRSQRCRTQGKATKKEIMAGYLTPCNLVIGANHPRGTPEPCTPQSTKTQQCHIICYQHPVLLKNTATRPLHTCCKCWSLLTTSTLLGCCTAQRAVQWSLLTTSTLNKKN